MTTFWIFRPKQGDYELIFNAPAHDVAVKETRSDGYRDVEVTTATGVRISKVLYKFDGAMYKASTGSSTRIP